MSFCLAPLSADGRGLVGVGLAVTAIQPGRPFAGGRDPIAPVRLAVATVAAIDTWAEKAGTSRSGAIRQWIDAGLKRRPQND